MNPPVTNSPGPIPQSPLPPLPALPALQTDHEQKTLDLSDSDAENTPADMYTPRAQSINHSAEGFPTSTASPTPPSPGTRAAAQLHEMYRNSPPMQGRLSSQAKLSILAEKDKSSPVLSPQVDTTAETVHMSPPISPLPEIPTVPRPPASEPMQTLSEIPPNRSRSTSNMPVDPSNTDGMLSNRTSSNSLPGSNPNLSINIGGPHHAPEGLSSANTPMSQNASHSRLKHAGSMEALGPIAREAETIVAYLRQAMSLKKIDILKEAKTKADNLLANPSFISACERLEQSDRNDPAIETTLQSVEALFSIHATFEPEIKRLAAESIEIIKYYLRQGVQLRNRDMIKEALLRLSHVDRALVEKSLLGPAEELIKELDAQHITIQYLASATTAKDAVALDDAIKKARLLNMREDECKELADAIKAQVKIREKSEKEQSRRVAGFVTKFFKNKSDKNDKKGDSTSSKALVKKTLFGTDLHEVTAHYSRSVSAHPKINEASNPTTTVTAQDTTPSTQDVENASHPDSKRPTKNVDVPVIVADCMNYILSHQGREEPGIFRLAGNRDIMAHIVSEYDHHFSLAVASAGSLASAFSEKDKEITPSPASELADVNDAANILKQFLRALPEPLIPFTAYSEWVQLGQKLRQHESDENIQALSALCAKLPVQCNNLLQYLAFHLSYLSENAEVNKMTEHNLAIVFAPNLLRPKVETSQTLISDSPVTILVVSSVIKYASKLF